MKQLINYCPVHGYEQEVNAYADGMKGYLKTTSLMGLNFMYISKNRIPLIIEKKVSVYI